MAALESRIDQLRRDAVDVAEGRKEFALSTDLQLKNAHILQKVSVNMLNILVIIRRPDFLHYTLSSDDKISDSTQHSRTTKLEAISPLEDNWISLASAIEEQHELFSESAQQNDSY
jgi:hypothetical protein